MVPLDGSGSSDPNNSNGVNPLNYQWTIASRPEESTGELITPNAVTTESVLDLEGLYIAQLVVNEGQLDSDPSTVRVQMVSDQTAATDSVAGIQIADAALDPAVFRNTNLQSTLSNKYNAVLRDITNGKYATAQDKLTNDILSETLRV